MFIRHSKIRESWIKVSNTTLKPHETDLEHYRYHSKLACLVESRNYNKIESLCNWSSDAYVKQEAEEAERQENDEKWWKTKVHIEVDVTGDDAELDNKMYEKMYGVEYGEDYGALFSLEDDIYEDKRENKTKIKKKTTVSLENEIVPFNINRFANLAGVELPEFCAINDSNLHHEITEDENSLLSEDDTTSFYPKINRQIVLLNELSKKCNTIATPISEVNMKDIPIFDIYNECKVEESIRVFSILKMVETRVAGLLENFQKNPALLDVLKLVDNIYKLEIHTTQVAKFCLGLQMLLEKIHVWDSNCPKSLKLDDCVDVINNMVIYWRRVEVKSWKLALKNASNKHKKLIFVAHWAHLYDSCKKLLKTDNLKKEEIDHWDRNSYPSNVVIPGENSEVKTTGINSKKLISFVAMTREFMQGSNLLEFQTRLKVLELMAAWFKKPEQTDENSYGLGKLIRNLHDYYFQFVEKVESLHKTISSGIEVQARDFVKIAKWHDKNFFSLRDSVEKSHRHLARLTRRYLDSLMEPVMKIFNAQAPNSLMMDVSGEFTAKIGVVKLSGNFPLPDVEISDVLENTINSKLLKNRVVKLSDKGCKNLTSFGDNFQENITELCEDLKNIVNDLQILKAVNEDDKAKIREMKRIQNQKLATFNDFMKTFRKFGISYRKGLIMKQQDHVLEIFKNLMFNRNLEQTKNAGDSSAKFYGDQALVDSIHVVIFRYRVIFQKCRLVDKRPVFLVEKAFWSKILRSFLGQKMTF